MNHFKTAAAAILCLTLALSAVSCKNDEKDKDKDAFAEITSATTIGTTAASTTTTTTALTATTTNPATTSGTTAATTTTTTTPATTVSTAPTSPPAVVTTTTIADSQLSFSTSNILRNNDEFAALMNDLNNIMYPYRNTVSFTYENIEKGVYISFNGDKRYNSCSTIKAPYSKMLLANNVALDEELVMTSSSVNGYSGRIDNMPVGTSFSVEYLIYRTIVYSDNTAYNILYENYGWAAFNDMTAGLGLSTKLGSGFNYRKVSSDEMRTYFKDIYNFCETENGAYLRDLLTDCDYNVQIGYALSQYEVAQKYGCQTSTRDLHDCAVVYAESPFVLTIMSDLDPDDVQSLAIFRQIAEIIDKINTLQTKPEETTTTTTTAAATTTTTTKKPATTTSGTTTTKKSTTTKPATTTPVTTVPVTTTPVVTTVPTTAQSSTSSQESTFETVQVETTTTAPVD